MIGMTKTTNAETHPHLSAGRFPDPVPLSRPTQCAHAYTLSPYNAHTTLLYGGRAMRLLPLRNNDAVLGPTHHVNIFFFGFGHMFIDREVCTLAVLHHRTCSFFFFFGLQYSISAWILQFWAY
jgi:hypothetical protein